MAVYGIKKGAWRRVPLNAPLPKRLDDESDEGYAARCAPTVAANLCKVVVRHRGRTKAIEIQAKSQEIERGEGVSASAAYIVRETVVGLEDFFVESEDPPSRLCLGPGVDIEVLVDELDGQFLLETVALAGLTAQAPSQRQSDF